MALESTRRGKGWPSDVRAAAEDLALDRDLSATQIRALIGERLSVDVPAKTIGRWVTDVRLRTPLDRADVLRETADRASLLLRAEVLRIERQSPTRRDLNRLDQAVRTLKTLDSIGPSKPGRKAQTLDDLSGPETANPEREASFGSTARFAA